MINLINNLVSKFKQGIIFIVLILVILGLVGIIDKERREYRNLKNSIHQQDGTLVVKRNPIDSLVVGTKETVTPTKNNFKTLYKADRDSFKRETGKHLKNIESIFKASIERKDSFVIIYKDSVINDTIKASCFSYQDEWFTIASCSTANVGFVKYYSRLRLKSYTYKTRKKEAWYTPWKWGKKLVTDVRSMNPKDSIVELESVILKK